MEDGLHPVLWYCFCNVQWCWCGRGLQVSTLTAGQQDEGNERGVQALAPGESTRGVEYKERGGMW